MVINNSKIRPDNNGHAFNSDFSRMSDLWVSKEIFH